MPKFAWLALATLLLVPEMAYGRDAAGLSAPALPAKAEPQESPARNSNTDARETGNSQTAYTPIPESEAGTFNTPVWDSSDSPLTFGTNVSNLGVGAEVGYRLHDFFGVRIAGNYFSDDFSHDYEGVDYEVDYTLMSAGALADFYPFRKYLRVSAGIYYNRNGADLYLPARDMTFNGFQVAAEDVGPMEGSVSFRSYAPYVGLGLQGSFFDGDLVVGADFGVFFQGSPDVELSGNSTFASNPQYQQEVDREIRKIEDDTEILGTYPVLSLSLTYRF